MKAQTLVLSIIIVNFNSCEYITKCLESILKDTKEMETEIIVVDNSSADNSVAVIRKLYPQVLVIENPRNIGFAAANNIAIKKARGKYILVLNPDTIISTGTTIELLNFMTLHPEIGMLSPKLIRQDGSLDTACRRSFPTPFDIYFHLLGLDRLFPNSKLFAHYNLSYLNPSESCEVDCVAGAFMLVRSAAVNMVGLMDERFFMYVEDIDWAHRFRLQGWQVYYYANREVLHYKHGSTNKEKNGMLPEFYKALYQGYDKFYAQQTPTIFNWTMFFTLRIFLFFALISFRIRKYFMTISQ